MLVKTGACFPLYVRHTSLTSSFCDHHHLQALPAESEVSAAIDARSLYARPFPMDATIDALTDFFAKAAPVNCVRLRRHFTSKSFKGSVFVELTTVEDMEKVGQGKKPTSSHQTMSPSSHQTISPSLCHHLTMSPSLCHHLTIMVDSKRDRVSECSVQRDVC